MKLIKLLILLLVVNTLIIVNLSNLHFKIFQNMIKYVINTKYHEERKNMEYISITYTPLSLIIYVIFKILLLLLIPVAPILFIIFLGYCKINNDNKQILRFISCNIKNEEHKNGFIDKYLWFKIFNKFNIPTPKVYAILKKDKLNVLDEGFDYNKKYIFKPIVGLKGRDIKFDSYNNIKKNNIKFGESMLIQERIYDCKYGDKKPRHIRLHSIYNEKENDVYSLTFLIFDGKEKKIMSNFHQGGIVTDCFDLKCEDLSKEEKSKIIEVTKKLLLLHKKIKRSMIGWDIILACDNAYVLEGNVCPGTNRLNNQSVKKYEKLFDEIY
jgi:hypothetical protein